MSWWQEGSIPFLWSCWTLDTQTWVLAGQDWSCETHLNRKASVIRGLQQNTDLCCLGKSHGKNDKTTLCPLPSPLIAFQIKVWFLVFIFRWHMPKYPKGKMSSSRRQILSGVCLVCGMNCRDWGCSRPSTSSLDVVAFWSVYGWSKVYA